MTKHSERREYESLPEQVKEIASKEKSPRKMECAHCGTELYDIRRERDNIDVFVTKDGRTPGDIETGGIPIEDSSAYPHQTIEENGIYLCGSCLDVDVFESAGTAVFAVDEFGNHYGALILGTIIDNHYLADSAEGSIFERTFEEYAKDEETLHLDDGTELVRSERNDTGDLIKRVKEGENPKEYPLFTNGNYLYVPVDAQE